MISAESARAPEANIGGRQQKRIRPKDRAAGFQLVTSHKLQLIAICCEVVVLGVVDRHITLQQKQAWP